MRITSGLAGVVLLFENFSIVGNYHPHTQKHAHTHTHTYIYIYCHPQTDFFVVSQLFGVARHAERCKLGSKLAQLYVRHCILPLSHQATYVGSRIITLYVSAFIHLHFAFFGYH